MIHGHGDDAFRFTRPIRANFSSNVYSHVELEPLMAHLRDRMAVIRNYPEPEPARLEAALQKVAGVPQTSICVTAGATEAIYLIAQAFRGARSFVCQPTFSEYADACRLHGHSVTNATDEQFRQDGTRPAGLFSFRRTELLGGSPGLLWLCNPNNPTGTVWPKDDLLETIDAHPETVFVIDQSYEAFTEEPLIQCSEAAERPNVLLLHSMTKRYAMPGLRLGYVTGSPALIGKIRAVRMPWPVHALAIEAGLYLADHPEAAPFNLRDLLAETQRLRGSINVLNGVEALPTQTHFFLCRLTQGSAAELKQYLAGEHGILIRDASNFEGLDGHYFRIATQTPAENDALVTALAQWLEKGEAR